MNKLNLNGKDVIIEPASITSVKGNVFEYYHRKGNNFYFRSEIAKLKISLSNKPKTIKKGEKFHIVF